MDEMLADDPDQWKIESARLSREDLVWLLAEILSTRLWRHPERPDVRLFRHPWVVNLVRGIENAPSDTLTIVSRGHCKTTTLFGKCIQAILQNQNATIGWFSIVKDLAQTSVQMVATELEQNDLLKSLHPTILYADPLNESTRWSIKDGIEVKRTMNFRDPTLKAFGLLDSSTTGARMTHQFYDDCVNEKVVSNTKMVEKANQRWGLSLNLGMPSTQRLYFGTFYGVGDSYHHMIDNGVRLNFTSCYEINRGASKFSDKGIPIRLVTDKDRPVLFSQQYLANQEEKMGPNIFAVQMLGVPSAVEVTDIDPSWILEYDENPEELASHLNVMILVDPAAAKGTNAHSYTAMAVIGLGSDHNYYLLDGVRDRLNLAQRMDSLFDLHRKWFPVVEVRYEQSGMSSDIEALRLRMEAEHYRFMIVPVSPGGVPKLKRCERIVPILRSRRLLVPKRGIWRIMKETGRQVNIVDEWLNKELFSFPNSLHLDFTDAVSRVEEPGLVNVWPQKKVRRDPWREEFYNQGSDRDVKSWMAV